MLAYVFWHWPSSDIAPDAYERLQVAFHRSLAEASVPGFSGSTVFRLQGQADWLGGEPAYADWYLLDDSAVLDALNEAAVSGVRKGTHDVLARAMGAGAGSLLQLRDGTCDLGTARWSAWVAKPRGMPYEPFYARMRPVCAQAGSSLWRRQMVLGPTTEFGLVAPQPLTLPPGLEPTVTLGLQPIA
jgi:hypothetical protein